MEKVFEKGINLHLIGNRIIIGTLKCLGGKNNGSGFKRYYDW